MAEKIYSEGIISRLTQYLKYVVQLKEAGKRTTTSKDISKNTGINSAEVRRDLNYFKIKGKRGVGFNIDELIKSFNNILGYNRSVRIALIGAGNLGRAILKYKMLERFGFRIECVFDNNPEVIGKTISGHRVLDINMIKDEIRKNNIEIAILAVPPDSAQKATDILVEAGVKVIINYTSVPIKAPAGVRVETTDPIEKLLHTLYYLSHTGYVECK
ncbi:MAG: redox-sensing transcriptional repressor Rex [Candidatus Humimicrobiaceae bacterium]|jgi:redox-sensing transcriptional repressor|nr:redox-sensing transcriptional repressor Rex [Actinomycetota bacterium]MDD5601144.1 redox-sensing transcriptional repressor Rex [Actinomycetota bacterium]MDY0027613.1 redox-sensing transcriptional repressor Rex [Candidatus Humimicrobiaceae bacterium]